MAKGNDAGGISILPDFADKAACSLLFEFKPGVKASREIEKQRQLQWKFTCFGDSGNGFGFAVLGDSEVIEPKTPDCLRGIVCHRNGDRYEMGVDSDRIGGSVFQKELII